MCFAPAISSQTVINSNFCTLQTTEETLRTVLSHANSWGKEPSLRRTPETHFLLPGETAAVVFSRGWTTGQQNAVTVLATPLETDRGVTLPSARGAFSILTVLTRTSKEELQTEEMSSF